jgi:hypothetical protein
MENFFSETSALYFLGAVLQADSAILAIVGIFLIFRLQYFQSIIDGIRNILFNKTTDRLKLLDTIYDFEVKEIEERIGVKTGDSIIDYLFNRWNLQDIEIRFLKSNIMMPVFLLFIGIVICMLGLIFSAKIHNYYGSLEIWVLSIVAVFHIFTYWLNVYTILFLILSRDRITENLVHKYCYKTIGWIYRIFGFPKFEQIKSNK